MLVVQGHMALSGDAFNRVMNCVGNTIVHASEDFTFCIKHMSVGFTKAVANICLTE